MTSLSPISVQNLYKIYSSANSSQFKAIDNLTLKVNKGEIFGIIGRSGAGKSTLMSCLNGLISPTSGTLEIYGKCLVTSQGSERRALLQQIGTIFQNFNLFSRLKVWQNIALPLKWQGKSSKLQYSQALEILKLVDLADKADAYPSQLSGGQCQRIAIARALVTQPSLLLCDEFTSALDPETSLEILSLLKKLNEQLGITILLITHDMTIIREICHQVAVMDKGQLVEQGLVEKVLLNPQHIVTQSLLSSLFNKDLPYSLQQRLQLNPTENCNAILCLTFSEKSAGEPVIADVIQQFHCPLNIIGGHLDHVRESAFGSLMISLPFDSRTWDQILSYFHQRQVTTTVEGYVPCLN